MCVFCVSIAYRYKLLKADFLIFVGVSSDEYLYYLSDLKSRQREAGFSEQLLQLKVIHMSTVVNVCKHTRAQPHTHMCT